MGQHWLLSKTVRDFSLDSFDDMTQDDAFRIFCKIRWGQGEHQVCPWCGVIDMHLFIEKRKQWFCKHCFRHFSVTTKTIWADRKLSYKKLLRLIYLFSSTPNGISASSLSRLGNVSYKTAWVFAHKLREAITRNVDDSPMFGEIHIDGGHFGGKPRSKCFRPSKKARNIAIAEKLSGKSQGVKRYGVSRENYNRRKKNRRIVMVARQVVTGQGAIKTRCFLSDSENEAVANYIANKLFTKGSIVRTDENAAYTSYSSNFIHETVEHSKEYCTPDGVHNNQAESYFSRLRRSEYGTFHRMEARYMLDYANEMAWREDYRKNTEKERLNDLISKTLNSGYSRWFRGYWQGFHRNDERKFNTLQ